MSNASEAASTVEDSSSAMTALPISQPVSSFEELPIEIHIMILRQMASPQDLYAALRASPTALGAFLSNRETILASVLERHISPEIFWHYVAVLTAPNYADFNYVAPFEPDWGFEEEDEPYDANVCEELRWEEWRCFAAGMFEHKIDIANRARSGGPVGEEHHWFTPKTSRVPTEKETDVFKQRVQSLAVMYGMVQRFVKDMQAFSFDTAQGQLESLQDLDFSNPPDDPMRWPSLSAGEQIRLQRGLLRYELSCRLLGTPFLLRNSTAFNPGGYSDDDPHWIIHDLMPSWELQEIVAVRAYVQKNYELLHLNVQSEFLADVHRLHRGSRASAPEVVNDVAYKQLPVPTGEEPQCPTHISWSHLGTIMGPSINWVDAMSRLGLAVLQNILRSDARGRPRLHGAMVSWIDSLPHRCSLNPYEFDSYADWIYPEGRQGGRAIPLKGANPVFLAAQKQRGTLYEDNSEKSLDSGAIRLQELGWVYWEDRARISALGLPRDDDGERRPEYQLAWHFADDVGRPGRYEVEGLLDQVKGVQITTDDWKTCPSLKQVVRRLGFHDIINIHHVD